MNASIVVQTMHSCILNYTTKLNVRAYNFVVNLIRCHLSVATSSYVKHNTKMFVDITNCFRWNKITSLLSNFANSGASLHDSKHIIFSTSSHSVSPFIVHSLRLWLVLLFSFLQQMHNNLTLGIHKMPFIYIECECASVRYFLSNLKQHGRNCRCFFVLFFPLLVRGTFTEWRK